MVTPPVANACPKPRKQAQVWTQRPPSSTSRSSPAKVWNDASPSPVRHIFTVSVSPGMTGEATNWLLDQGVKNSLEVARILDELRADGELAEADLAEADLAEAELAEAEFDGPAASADEAPPIPHAPLEN